MSRAVAGQPYTIKKGDTLTGVSVQAYGHPKKWKDIYAANQKVLRSGDPHLIFPGEVINVPIDTDKAQALSNILPDFADKDPDEMTFIIDGYEVFGVESATITRTIDTPLDGWRLITDWDPDNAEHRKAFAPYRYQHVDVGIGQNKVMETILYKVSPSFNLPRREIELTGFSGAVDIVDSTKAEGPYEVTNVTLKQWAETLAKPFSSSVNFAGDPPSEKFSRLEIDKKDKIGEHLQGLAKQRKLLLSCTAQGGLLFLRAEDSPPVAQLVEGSQEMLTVPSVDFDARQRFASYKAIGKNPRSRAIIKVARDTNVTRSRFTSVSADDATVKGVQDAADWARSSQLAKSLSISFDVPGWYTSDGTLWAPGQTVEVESPTVFLFEARKLLIRQVDYKLSADNHSTTLTLVPIETYNGGTLEDPWQT